MKPKFRPKTILFHKLKNVYLWVDSVENMGDKGFLYRLKVLATVAETHYKDEWKSYYEDKIAEQCFTISSPKAVEVLYGQVEA